MGSVATWPLFLRVLHPVLESGVQALVIATLAWLKPQETGYAGSMARMKTLASHDEPRSCGLPHDGCGGPRLRA